jgi:hypothetical protein
MLNNPSESRFGALLGDLAQFTSKLKASRPSPEQQAQHAANEAKLPETKPALPADLPYRLEQWNKDELKRVILASARLDVALEGWAEAVRLNPRATWRLYRGEDVLKQHRAI